MQRDSPLRIAGNATFNSCGNSVVYFGKRPAKLTRARLVPRLQARSGKRNTCSTRAASESLRPA